RACAHRVPPGVLSRGTVPLCSDRQLATMPPHVVDSMKVHGRASQDCGPVSETVVRCARARFRSPDRTYCHRCPGAFMLECRATRASCGCLRCHETGRSTQVRKERPSSSPFPESWCITDTWHPATRQHVIDV